MSRRGSANHHIYPCEQQVRLPRDPHREVREITVHCLQPREARAVSLSRIRTGPRYRLRSRPASRSGVRRFAIAVNGESRPRAPPVRRPAPIRVGRISMATAVEELARPAIMERRRTGLHRFRHRAIGRMIALSLRSRKPLLDSLPLLFEQAACNVVSILHGNVLERADGGQQLLERLSAWVIMLRNGDST